MDWPPRRRQAADETPAAAGVEAPSLPLALDAFEAARMLGVDHKTLRREIDRGRLRGFKVGRLLRIQTAELLAYIRRQEKA